MPNTKSAIKALRVSERKAVVNERRRKTMREVLKDIKKLSGEKKKDEANSLLSKAYKAIDKAAKQGVIKKNTAARKKSRLSAAIKKIG